MESFWVSGRTAWCSRLPLPQAAPAPRGAKGGRLGLRVKEERKCASQCWAAGPGVRVSSGGWVAVLRHLKRLSETLKHPSVSQEIL